MSIKDELSKRGISAKTLTVKELGEFIQSSDFTNPVEALEDLEYIEKMNEDDYTKTFVRNLKIMVLFGVDEDIIGKVFKSKEDKTITRDELIEKVNNFMTSEDPIFVLLSAICGIMTGLSDFKEYEDTFKVCIEKIHGIMDSLGHFNLSFGNFCNLMDTLYYFSNSYFNVNDIDLLKDEKWVNEYLDKMHKYEDDYIEQNGRSVYDDIDLKPQDLGYLDITEKEENNAI